MTYTSKRTGVTVELESRILEKEEGLASFSAFSH